MPIIIRPQGWVGRLADTLMKPLMYLLQGTVWEEPQRTHFWNNSKFSRQNLLLRELDPNYEVGFPGDSDASNPLWLGIFPRFHMPVMGGWRNYEVFLGSSRKTWYIGWFSEHGHVGVSRIPLDGPVRMLRGPGATRYFAVDETGQQLMLSHLGSGRVGRGGRYANIPLL